MLTTLLCVLNHLFPQQAALLTLYPQAQPDSPESAHRLHQIPASICRTADKATVWAAPGTSLSLLPLQMLCTVRSSIALTVVPCLTSASRDKPIPTSEKHFFQKHFLTVPGAFLLGRILAFCFKKYHPIRKQVFGAPLPQSTI